MPRPFLRPREHRNRGLADGFVLLGLAAVVGLGAGTLRKFERRAEADIAARLEGEEKRVKLRVSYPGLLSPALGEVREAKVEASNFSVVGLPFLREPWRSSRGKIERLIVDLRDFELTGLPVERLRASIPSVRFDLGHASKRGEIRISRSGRGRAEVRLKPEGIAAWIMRRTPSLRGVVGRIEDGKLGLSGRVRFAGFEVPFDVLSDVGGEGPRLSLVKPRIQLAGIAAEGARADELVKALNPVVDADRDLALRGAVGIERVRVEDGKIVATGSVVLPEAERTPKK